MTFDYLITGGNGFIGQNLVNNLISTGKTFKVQDLKLVSKGDICVDVTQRIPTLIASNLVHLASETNVRNSIEFPTTSILNNCKGVINCLESIREKSLFNKFIFTSSASSEQSKSPYLASKLSCESICTAYSQSYGIDVRILKLSNVYGPHSVHKQSVIPRFIKSCINHSYLTIYGNGKQQRDFIYIDDVINAITSGESGYVSTGKGTSIIELATIISAISEALIGFRPRIVYENQINGEVYSPKFISDISPKTSLNDGLLTTFKWFVKYYENQQLGSS